MTSSPDSCPSCDGSGVLADGSALCWCQPLAGAVQVGTATRATRAVLVRTLPDGSRVCLSSDGSPVLLLEDC